MAPHAVAGGGRRLRPADEGDVRAVPRPAGDDAATEGGAGGRVTRCHATRRAAGYGGGMSTPTQPSFFQQHITEIGAAVVLILMVLGIVAANLLA